MKTCFLLTHVPDPKTNKRIKIFKERGNVSVICARRKSQDIWEPAFDDVEHYIYDVDLPTVQHIIKRFVVSKIYRKKAKKKLKEIRPDVIYADGLDSLFIAAAYKGHNKVKLFYDVADLRETYIEAPKQIFKRIINEVIKYSEKKRFVYIDYLVITSEKFYSVYYHNLISQDKVIFIPNAPDKEVFKSYEKKRSGEFTIGFIGGIRYLNQMKMLVDAAEKCGYQVIFAGAGGTSKEYEEITSYCKNKGHVKFTGKYDYNKEIAGLYGMVDCIYAVYNADNLNVQIALPNKLYESVICKLPIIVARGTYLSDMVEKWGIGFSVNHKNIDELCHALDQIASNENLRNEIEENCKRHTDECTADSYYHIFPERL